MRTNFRIVAAAVAATAALLALAVPAGAHVTANPADAEPGSYARVDFRVPHGCAGRPTDTVEIKIPDGVVALKPQNKPGWTVTTETVDAQAYELHGQTLETRIGVVRWSGGSLPDSQFDDFAISAKLPDEPGRVLVFPTVQRCGDAQEAWLSPPNADGSEPDKPAPTVSLGRVDDPASPSLEARVMAVEATVRTLERGSGGGSSDGLAVASLAVACLALVIAGGAVRRRR